MSKDSFAALVRQVTDVIAGKPVDAGLAAFLNDTFPEDSPLFRAIEAAILQGAAEGWVCEREHGGIRYGRVLKADESLSGFSVDVVHMSDLAGPHHRHPGGEIDMILPVTTGASFDGAPRGWLAYGPDSAHRPTVTGGAAYVLYLLPGGEIEFTRAA